MPQSSEENQARARRELERLCRNNIVSFAKAGAYRCAFTVTPYHAGIGVFDVDRARDELIVALRRASLSVERDPTHPYKIHIGWAPAPASQTAHHSIGARSLEVDLTDPYNA